MAARIQGKFGEWRDSITKKALTPAFLMKLLWNRLQRDVRIWASTMFMFIALKTAVARSVNGPKLQRPHADAMAKPYLKL